MPRMSAKQPLSYEAPDSPDKAPPLGWKVIIFLLFLLAVVFGALGWVWHAFLGGSRFLGS